MDRLIEVDEARARILAALRPLPAEVVSLAAAHGRVLAEDLTARVTQPPLAVSAMDGYAVRAAEARLGARLPVDGEAAAGTVPDRPLKRAAAMRIFTGAPVPDEADAVVIQEETDREGAFVIIRRAAIAGANIRAAGIDFAAGDLLIPAGTLLTARHIGLAAAMNRPWLTVYRKPVIAMLATGDEVAMPGDPLGPAQIVSSNGFLIAAMAAAAGAETRLLGIAPDDAASLTRLLHTAAGADLLVTTGGASVGDHDLVRATLLAAGGTLDFWKIAMRPGKPMLWGEIRSGAATVPLLGLPGNPVSCFVTGFLFLIPALERLQGRAQSSLVTDMARLTTDLPPVGNRSDYQRARLARDGAGGLTATPAGVQDSSLLSVLASSDGLLVRVAGAQAAPAGSSVPVLRFPGGVAGY